MLKGQSVTRLIYDQDTLEMPKKQKYCVKTSEQGYLVCRPTKHAASTKRECAVRAARVARIAWSKKEVAESQTDSSRYHAVRACENGHVK
jgi:hypothetical protein